jgi:hypothetical protein
MAGTGTGLSNDNGCGCLTSVFVREAFFLVSFFAEVSKAPFLFRNFSNFVDRYDAHFSVRRFVAQHLDRTGSLEHGRLNMFLANGRSPKIEQRRPYP